jgi:hypothetical protein
MHVLKGYTKDIKWLNCTGHCVACLSVFCCVLVMYNSHLNIVLMFERLKIFNGQFVILLNGGLMFPVVLHCCFC